MVDFRSSGVKSGGLGVYSSTKSLSSPASSSLDKSAGTLSSKSKADIVASGVAAQQLINTIPRELSDEYTAAQRSYAYAEGLKRSDVLLEASNTLLNKWVAQATPEQRKSLIDASQTGDVSIGLQRSIQEKIKDAALGEVTKQLGGETGFNWLPIAIIGGAALLLGGKK